MNMRRATRSAALALALVTLTTLTAAAPGSIAAQAQTKGDGASREGRAGQRPPALCPGSERPSSRRFAAATRGDDEFNAVFRHCFRTVDGVQMHFVIGGAGSGDAGSDGATPPLVLLHGWPQTWFEWRGLLPELAADRTVIAVDLPGLGDSTGSPPSFDKATLAGYVHGLVADTLGYPTVDIASHDLGSGVGWAYANEYPGEVGRLAVMDFPLPGPGCPEAQIRQLSYHFSLFQEPGVPELLIDDEVRPFLETFYPHVSPKTEPIPPSEVTEYVRTYRRSENLRNGFELYRALPTDEADNRRYAGSPVTIPVLLLTQDSAFEFEAACYLPMATDLSGTAIAGAGHWLNEEDPVAVLAQFAVFFGTSERG